MEDEMDSYTRRQIESQIRYNRQEITNLNAQIAELTVERDALLGDVDFFEWTKVNAVEGRLNIKTKQLAQNAARVAALEKRLKAFELAMTTT
jgi:hypothetical protein